MRGFASILHSINAFFTPFLSRINSEGIQEVRVVHIFFPCREKRPATVPPIRQTRLDDLTLNLFHARRPFSHNSRSVYRATVRTEYLSQVHFTYDPSDSIAILKCR